jgi:hypothetical protein
LRLQFEAGRSQNKGVIDSPVFSDKRDYVFLNLPVTAALDKPQASRKAFIVPLVMVIEQLFLLIHSDGAQLSGHDFYVLVSAVKASPQISDFISDFPHVRTKLFEASVGFFKGSIIAQLKHLAVPAFNLDLVFGRSEQHKYDNADEHCQRREYAKRP